MHADLLKTKTFWVGFAAVVAAIVHAFFPGETAVSFGAAVKNLLSDPTLYAGGAFVTLRDALLRNGQSAY